MTNVSTVAEIHDRLRSIVDALIAHDGFGSVMVEVRLLKRGQKEVIVHFGRQFRYVIDFVPSPDRPRSSTGPTPDDVRS